MSLFRTPKVLAFLLNPKNVNAEFETNEALKAANALGLQLILMKVTTKSDIDNSLAGLSQQHIDALLIAGDAFFQNQRGQIVGLAQRNGIPAFSANPEAAVAGSLMSYGASQPDTYREVGNYVGRVLRGEKPGDLPIQQPTKFEFVINMRTAKALRLTIPQSMLLLADEVIE